MKTRNGRTYLMQLITFRWAVRLFQRICNEMVDIPIPNATTYDIVAYHVWWFVNDQLLLFNPICNINIINYYHSLIQSIRLDTKLKRSMRRLSPRLPWWILTYRLKYANIPKYCGNELILHSTYRFWNLLFIVESDDFIWKNTSFWFQICFCLKYFIIFYYANRIFKISP